MFLQGDKPNPTLTRDRAARALFDNEETMPADAASADTFVNFSYNHNVAEFKNLVQSKYPQTFNSFDTLQSSDGSAFGKYITTKNEYEASSTPTQKYYNDTNPIPQQYQSFRPKILTDFEDLHIPSPKGELDEALLQKIDEIQIIEPKISTEKIAFENETSSDIKTESYLKLNAKGLIACVTFVAVTLLIIFLVIFNSVAIGNSNNQIRRLRDENSELRQQYNKAEYERQQAYQKGVDDANDFAGSATQIGYESLPPVSSYALTPSNPDASTNLFDKISKFFSSLFN